MAICNFCGREFSNGQAVRAHLKSCPAYRDRPDAGVTPETPSSAVPTEQPRLPRQPEAPETFDPVEEVRQQIETERLALELRKVRAAHGDLNAQEAAREKERLEAQRLEREAAQEAAGRAQRAAQQETRRQQQAAAEQGRQQRRRELIQTVKRQVIDGWSVWLFDADLRAQWERVKASALLQIERQLALLPVEELPHHELVAIATAIRDRLYAPIERERDRLQETSQRQAELKRYARDYLHREVAQIEGLDFFERHELEQKLLAELDAEITGDESQADITAEIDSWLDAEFGGDDADDESRD